MRLNKNDVDIRLSFNNKIFSDILYRIFKIGIYN